MENIKNVRDIPSQHCDSVMFDNDFFEKSHAKIIDFHSIVPTYFMSRDVSDIEYPAGKEE